MFKRATSQMHSQEIFTGSGRNLFMKTNVKKLWKKFLIITLGLVIGMIVFFNTKLIRETTYAEGSQHLDELSQQMAASIERQSRGQWNMLDMFHRYFKDIPEGDWTTLSNYVQNKKEDWGFDSLCVVDENAMYYDRTNSFSLLSREEISKDLLTDGKPVILDNTLSVDGNKLIFLTPVDNLTIGGKEFRAIGVAYNSQNLFDILNIQAFDGSAMMYITHKDGVVLFRTNQEATITGYNLINSLEESEFDNGTIDMLRENIKSGTKELMTVKWENEEYYLNHIPVSVADWQLITLVPVDVVSGRMIHSSVITFLCVSLIGVFVILAFVLLYSDSAKKVLKAEEAARRAAENANLSKSQFLSNMSHDIRTPMNAIIGMTKIATDHIEEKEKVKDCLKKIDLSGRLLVGLINDILDMSKIESGKMMLNNDRASLVELMQNLVGITQPTVREKKQNFNIRLQHIQHEILVFDALRLNQVMINLLGNALKFTPVGGSVSLDVIEQPAKKAGYAHFIFQVSDTGIGISEEFQKNLFTSFTRERDSKIDKIEGSGLGLAITKMIVDMMEGTIIVDSTLGKGSTFTVELDLLLAQAPEEMKLPKMRILVADDDLETCQSAAAYLQELGVVADIALSGKEAISKVSDARARKEEYRMIFLDWRMPDLDGTKTAKKIRKLVGREVPILIISAYDWSGIELEAGKAGVDGFIQKPFFKSTLYHNIKKYCFHENATIHKQALEQIDLSEKRILLVDDNEINLEIAQDLLLDMNAQVEIARDGQEVVDIFQASAIGYYDIILMDIQMPRMNGYEATKAIRCMHRKDATTIPIFAMTADAFADDIEMAKQAGMNAHLAKPLNVTVMMREIKKHLHS